MVVCQRGWIQGPDLRGSDWKSSLITQSEHILYPWQINGCQTPMKHSIRHVFGVFFQLWPPENLDKVNLTWRGIPPAIVRV